MSQLREVSKAIAARYEGADKTAKGVNPDALRPTTGRHRNHDRKALATR